MIELKQNDWVLNILGNPELGVSDFSLAGLSALNTSLLDENTYLSSLLITENPFFKNNEGEFDKNKFHTFYENASLSYNILANKSFNDDMAAQQTIFGKDDIFAPLKQRRTFEDTVGYYKRSNPDKTTTGLIRLGETSKPRFSSGEIALTQKVLANPTEVYDAEGNPDWSKAIWHEAPNDSWFTDFFDTRVKALWDSDGEHKDPITGEIVLHKKGLYKLNEEGTYYYENLDGRDIYGREVLNKMNTLTTDGSTWNKYDFFDSDDINLKSAGKTIAKNLALVGSMFIPYVGPWVAGLSVATLLVGISGILGKMLLGSDSPTFSAMEGWSKSLNRQTAKSDYAMQNTWCWENFISLIGDVAGQLKELRFLFEYVPALFKGTDVVGLNGISKAKLLNLATNKAKKYDKFYETKLKDLKEAKNKIGETLTAEELAQYQTAKSSVNFLGQKDVEKFMKSYNHIGEVLSKGYMTAITVGDIYGEAISLGGASDIEAFFLTIGYAAAEAKLLNTELGNWVLPELKASKLKNKAIIEGITNVPKEMRIGASLAVTNTTTLELKKESAKYWVRKGRDIFNKVASSGKGLTGMALSGGLGEGFEEVSEEVLSDIMKTSYNVLLWLLGELDTHHMQAWDNIRDRYLMSFIGGAVGGGLTAVGTNFKVNNSKLTSQEAIQELIYKIRNNEVNDLFKSLDKMEIANPYLLMETEVLEDGTEVFKPSNSKTSNMDKDIKKAFKLYVSQLRDIIEAEGLNVSDKSFLDAQTFKDIRLASLQQSAVSGLFLLDFNKLCQDICDTRIALNNLSSSKKDTEKNEFTEGEKKNLSNLKEILGDLLKKKEAYLNGDLAIDYISASLMDLTPMLSRYYTMPFFKDFAENKYHKKFEDLNEQEKEEAKAEFDNLKETEYKNNIAFLAPTYLKMARNSGAFIQEYAKNYQKIKLSKNLQDLINIRLLALREAMSSMDIDAENVLENYLDDWISELLEQYLGDVNNTAFTLFRMHKNQKMLDYLKSFTELIRQLDPTTDKKQIDKATANFLHTIYLELLTHLDDYFNEYELIGAINPEIKNELILVLLDLQKWSKEILVKGFRFTTDNLALDIDESLLEDSTYLDDFEYEDYDNLLYKLSPNFLDFSIQDKAQQIKNYFEPISKALGLKVSRYRVKDLKDLNNLIDTKINELELHLNKLEEAPYTDSIAFIKNFIQQNSDSSLNIDDLLNQVNGILNQSIENLGNANLDALIENIEEAIKVIKWLLGLVLGAQVDRGVSLSNLIGYNPTLNEIAHKKGIKDWEDLPEISVLDSLVINQDLELIKNKLVLAKNIYYINLGRKLNKQTNVAINTNFIVYNKLKRFIISVGDDWDKTKLEDAINNCKLLKLYSETRDLKNLTDLDKNDIFKESFILSHAVYEFFLDNKDHLNDLSKLFEKSLNVFENVEQILNEDTEYLSDRNFLHWLSSRAAIDKNLFNNEFKLVINLEGDNIIAPLPTLEEAVFLNISEILNGDMNTLFMNAFREAFLNKFNSLSTEDKIKTYNKIFKVSISELDLKIIEKNKDMVNCDLLPIYTNIYLTEGIPGAGKSDAVDYYTVQILKQFHKSKTEKVLVAHDSLSKAKNLGKKFNLENALYFDKESLMTFVYSKYNKKRATNSKGDYLYNSEEWEYLEDGRIVFKAKSDDISKENLPSLIVIDEVSHFDLADLMLLDDFARKYGITIITSGDFSQSSITAKCEEFGPDNRPLTISPFRSHFKSSPKMGVSMRTANLQLEKSISSYINWSKEYLDKKNFKFKLKTFYYEDEKIGLNGVKNVGSGDTKELERTIDLMISTLKPTKDGSKPKIGYIYSKENTSTYKLLSTKYKDYVTFFSGNAAQGLEGLYYIIDNEDTSKDLRLVYKDFYTGLTRASLGVLVTKAPMPMISNREEITTYSGYSLKGLLNYATRYKQLLEETTKDMGTLPDFQRSSVENSKKVKESEETEDVVASDICIEPLLSIPIVVDADRNEIKYIWENLLKLIKIKFNNLEFVTNGIDVGLLIGDNKCILLDKSNKYLQEILDIFNNFDWRYENTLRNENTEDPAININNLNSHAERPKELVEYDKNDIKKFNYLLHSHNTFELGVKDNKGKVEFYESDLTRYKYRFDSAIGLMKIYEKDWTNPQLPTQFYINKIKLIRNIAFSIKDKNKLIYAINRVLLDSSLTVEAIEFGLVSCPRPGKNNKSGWGNASAINNEYGALDKSDEERTLFNNNPDPNASKVNRKTINITITSSDKKRLTLPLFVLGNLDTYIGDSNPISKRLKEIYEENEGDPVAFHKGVIKDASLNAISNISNLAKLFLFTSGGYFKIDDELWTPANNLRNWGILVNVKAEAGGYYPYNGKNSFTPIRNFLHQLGYTISKQIYTTLLNPEDASGIQYPIAKKGHAFILITQDPDLITDLDMRDYYIKQVLDPSLPKKVTRIYVLPPKVSVEQYLRNLHSIIYEKDPELRKNIKIFGSHVTSYNVWKALYSILQKNDGTLSVSQTSREKILQELDKLKDLETKSLDNERTSNLVKALMGNSEWKGVNTSKVLQTLLEHFNYQLVSLFTAADNSIIEDKLSELVKLIESLGLDHIFYSTAFKNVEPGKNLILVPLESDLDLNGNSTYTLNGLDFSINAKIDSNLFSGDESFNNILSNFVSKISLGSGTKDLGVPHSSDTDAFVLRAHKKLNSNTAIEERILKLDIPVLGLSEIKYIFDKKNNTYFIGKNLLALPGTSIEFLSLNDVKTILSNSIVSDNFNIESASTNFYINYIESLIKGQYQSKLSFINNTLLSISLELNLNNTNMIALFYNELLYVLKLDKDKLLTLGMPVISLDGNNNFIGPSTEKYTIKCPKGRIEINLNTRSISYIENPSTNPNNDDKKSNLLILSDGTIIDFNRYLIPDFMSRLNNYLDASAIRHINKLKSITIFNGTLLIKDDWINNDTYKSRVSRSLEGLSNLPINEDDKLIIKYILDQINKNNDQKDHACERKNVVPF